MRNSTEGSAAPSKTGARGATFVALRFTRDAACEGRCYIYARTKLADEVLQAVESPRAFVQASGSFRPWCSQRPLPALWLRGRLAHHPGSAAGPGPTNCAYQVLGALLRNQGLQRRPRRARSGHLPGVRPRRRQGRPRRVVPPLRAGNGHRGPGVRCPDDVEARQDSRRAAGGVS